MISVSEIAKYIIKFFQEREDPITNLKLQKLLYYVQGWHLALHNQPAFPEPLQAWVHGPAQPQVYAQYKKFRWNPISEEISVSLIKDPHLIKHIEEVLSVYGTETAYALEHRTHLEAPWQNARQGLPPDAESNAEITPDSMKAYFQQQMNSNE
jgi:uncharacterized phage-associated protein